MHLNGPGGPGGVAVAGRQEDRGNAYVRAAWFDLRSGRGNPPPKFEPREPKNPISCVRVINDQPTA